MKPADRLNRLKPQFFADLERTLETLRSQGADLIRLDVGSPDMPPITEIIDSLTQTARQPDRHGYQPHAGGRALRSAWEAYYRRRYKVLLNAEEEILPLLGSKDGISHLPFAVINPGDIVLVPDPGYITYTQGALLAGGEPYYLPLLPENDYLPDLEAVPDSVKRRARLLWLNYPNNPTGATASLNFFRQAVEFAYRNDLLVCHDAAYSQVTFDDFQAPSILQVPGAQEVALEFNTLSKSHNMAGWRVGVAVGHAGTIRALYRLKTNLDSGHFAAVEAAAVTALRGDQLWLAGRNCVYQGRRDTAVSALKSMGLKVYKPGGGLYIWFAAPPGWSGMDFTRMILEQTHVSLAPGIIFGEQGAAFVRLAICISELKLKTALERIAGTQPQWDKSPGEAGE